MSTSITIRHMDPGDKSWLQREARRVGVSMEDLVRRMIHDKRIRTERRPEPSEAFARYFGEEHGAEIPPPAPGGYKPLTFSREKKKRLLRLRGLSTRTSSPK